MKRTWEIDELVEQFTLRPDELSLLSGGSAASQLGMAVLLKFFQHEARFPSNRGEVPEAVVSFLARQLGVEPSVLKEYGWTNNTIKTHRQTIRRLYEFRRASRTDQRKVQMWLYENAVPQEHNVERLKEMAYQRFQAMHREPPTADQVKTLVNGAISTYERYFYRVTLNRLPADVRDELKRLLDHPTPGNQDEEALEEIPFHELKAEPGEPSVANVKLAATRLERLREVKLPTRLFDGFSLRFIQKHRQRAAGESISGIKRQLEQSPAIGNSLLAAFSWVRLHEVTDQMIEMFDQLINTVEVRAERKVTRALVQEVKHVRGKDRLFYRLATKMIEKPQGVIEEVLYPIADQDKLQDVVKEYEATGSSFQYSVQMVVRGSYNHHYRQMLPDLLRVLEFRSNNPANQPILDALAIVRTYAASNETWYPAEATVNTPLDGVIESGWQDWVTEYDEDGQKRIRRVNYELCVLQALREKLRHKQIWVVGADHYRNPDEDLPADFDERRDFYYQMLRQTQNAEEFIRVLKQLMRDALRQFNNNLPKNSFVKITTRKGKPIKLSKSPRQEEPLNLKLLKGEVAARWGIHNLLDVLKEVELRINLAQHFPGTGVGRRLKAEVFQKRLLLCLYALGTNSGLSRVALNENPKEREHYTDLEYVQRRYIHPDALRNAITAVVNATLAARNPQIWGDATTCASDSKRFAANDHSLLTQWHNRYKQAGVVIYWHVERRALCIFSQLKTCSSSEVAAMIEGVLHHCTQMQVDKNYVDTHGASEIAFAFAYLLNFQLLPRLKDIYRQQLSLPDESLADALPNLSLILGAVIDWELIREQYDSMVQYATALRLGTAEAEAILKRFRAHSQHPTYKALLELGKAVKTIFVCRYLDSEELRLEIHEGLNVIEHWNSTNRFIFFGKNSELQSTKMEAQERSMLALHLLQSCLVYINTLMLQKVLEEPAWLNRMTAADWRGVTPLFYNHINPYGSVVLNMKRRINIDSSARAA